MLPNLIVIGAAKCGTTSLHEYLSLHPEIAMSAKKELDFFVRDDWRDRLDWYADQFPDAPVRGESSPGYTMAPYRASTAERIVEVVPEARIVYLVRDPVERAIASYTEFVMHRLEPRPVDEALRDLRPENPHLAGSRYGTQIAPFVDRFGRDRVLVVDQHALLRDRRDTLHRVFSFLGVDPAYDSPAFDRLHNARDAKVRYNDLGMWLIRRGWFTDDSGPVRGPLRPPLRQLLSRPIDAAPGAETRAVLADVLAPEIEKLHQLTGFTPQQRWLA